MNYKGDYSAGTAYSVGDIAVYTDGVPYILHTAAAAGTTCHDVLHWRRLDEPFASVAVMLHGAVNTIPNNISDEAITLKTDDGEYLITVDDSGDDPELAVTAIEEEGD